MALADALAKYKEEVTKPSSRVSFKGILDAYLFHREEFQSFSAEIKRNSLQGFHPSGLFDACPRQIAFQYLHEIKKLKAEYAESVGESRYHSARMELLFDFGHAVHMLIQYGYLPHIKGLKYQTEVAITELWKEYMIAGTADIVVTLQDKKQYVCDIKTMRGEVFAKTNTADDLSPEYVTQLNLYMEGLGIPRGFFFLVNKNDSETKEIFLTKSPTVLRPVLVTASSARGFIKGGVHPPVLTECRKKEGRYKKCDFASVCMACTPQKKLSSFLTK